MTELLSYLTFFWEKGRALRERLSDQTTRVALPVARTRSSPAAHMHTHSKACVCERVCFPVPAPCFLVNGEEMLTSCYDAELLVQQPENGSSKCSLISDRVLISHAAGLTGVGLHRTDTRMLGIFRLMLARRTQRSPRRGRAASAAKRRCV